MESFKDNLKTILNDLIPQLNEITIKYMVEDGVKKKSNLVKSVNFIETDNGLALSANYYFVYVSQGRRKE